MAIATWIAHANERARLYCCNNGVKDVVTGLFKSITER